jgi:hypothetical protein
MNYALHHFHNHVTDQTALQNELLSECRRLAAFEGQNASHHCTDVVNANIDKIFADLQQTQDGDFAASYNTCYDIGECGGKVKSVV